MVDCVPYLNNLDVWIVSHGGCGSNYIVDLFEENNIYVRDGRYGELCHRAYIPKGVNTKILYIYGDIINSMCSQSRRRNLETNINKLKFNTSNKDVNDPYNYLYQYNNFNKVKNNKIVKLKYPYTKEDILNVASKLDININPESIEIKPRTKKYEMPYPKLISDVLKYYENSILQ